MLRLLIKPEKQLTFLYPLVRLNRWLLGSLLGRISAEEFSFNFFQFNFLSKKKLLPRGYFQWAWIHPFLSGNKQLKCSVLSFSVKFLYLFIKVIDVERHIYPKFLVGRDASTFHFCYFWHSIYNDLLERRSDLAGMVFPKLGALKRRSITFFRSQCWMDRAKVVNCWDLLIYLFIYSFIYLIHYLTWLHVIITLIYIEHQ